MWLKETVAAIIPASRDKKSIFNVIQELDATGFVDEIIVVDNEVDEGTLKQINKTRARFIKQRKYGFGRAIRKGIESTKASLLIITEANGTFRAKDVSKLLSYSEDFDTVFGSRTHIPLIEKDSGMTFLRRLVDDLFGKMISILFLSSNLTDVGCTFRLTNRRGWRKVAKDCVSDNEMFLTEWLIAAAKNSVKFIEIPVNFTTPKGDIEESRFSYLVLRGITIIVTIIKTWLLHIITR